MSSKKKQHKLDPCEYCDGFIDNRERQVRVFRHRGEAHFIFENVPARVCSRCGERYYSAKVAREMDRLMKEGAKGARQISVPVIPFGLAA
jgi:YgiT-type zinc finger domain-containing protein